MKSQEQSYRLTIAQEQPRSFTQTKEQKRIRHVYLQQENIYGRFIPYLLLRDQLESQIDSSGNTALHHMCSYNSPYLKLFLSTLEDGDPILNRKNKLGHTPLDAAGLYCSREHVEMLKAKGAIDDGNVDFWAIQGGVPTNWSGKILPNKKQLIHWAAYNDMPQVITQYAKQGISISQQDNNGYTPIQLTILNKSYSSMKILADLGEIPKKQLISSSDSQSIKEFWKQKQQSHQKKNFVKTIKFLTLVLFLTFCLVLDLGIGTITTTILSVLLILNLLLRKPPVQRFMDNDRKSQFTSQLLFSQTINRNNHSYYILLHITLISSGISSLQSINFTCHLQAILAIYLIICTSSYTIHLFAQIYAILNNLTYDELFNSYRWPHLWEKVKYVPQKKLVINQFSNPEDKGKLNNFKYYFGI